MASVLGLERSPTSTADTYDHAISLFDSTLARDEAIDNGEASSDSALVSNDGEDSRLSRQWTRPHLRKELARRKYAKWQQEVDEEGLPRTSVDTNDDNTEESDGAKKPAKQGTWGTQGRLRDKVAFRPKKKKPKASADDTTFIDVLYENQRGSFFCGIPLYSAKSLLNLDPSAWQNSTFQDSPINITNAQVPDPSWAWDWRTWYVDMSHDVDEEGWEYSFSFSPNFAWHGNHPWFHSFCRRRRWLRRRVKIHGRAREKKEGGDGRDEHKLTADYFTIHASRQDRSRSTSGDRSATRRSSTMAGFEATEDVDELNEIPNVSALMIAMKRARVDREKITAVKQFLDQGGDELFYLADTVTSIMEDFIYQTSRQQLQSCLLQALQDAIKAESSSQEDDTEKQKSTERRVNNLMKAVDVAGVRAHDRGRLSALKARAAGEDKLSIDPIHDSASTAGSHVEFRDDIAEHIAQEGGVADEIKGISKDAEISIEPGIRRPTTETEDATKPIEEEEKEKKKLDKGKEKEQEA